MNNNSKNYRKKKLKISNIETTNERLTGRAGLTPFVSYLHQIEIFPWIDKFFGSIRKNKKGIEIFEIFKQVLCFMADGTSRHLTYFDQIYADTGYAAAIETETQDMASSHQIKRFFKAFSWNRIFLFRHLLQKLFMWRLKIKEPKVIELGIDTMVMDNDDAQHRHGVKTTYRKIKGFQPLQMNWGNYIVDAVFRGGNKHSNHGETVKQMICHIVKKIRKEYRDDVPIIIRMDSGFFDQEIFETCEKLETGYVCGGKIYKDTKAMADNFTDKMWKLYNSKKKDRWEYVDFGIRYGSWNRFRRGFYCRVQNNGNQLVLPGFNDNDKVIISNIGQGQKIDELLKAAEAEDYLKAESIIACYHERGSDELANRALKDFGHEQLPFKRFSPNSAWYYSMLLGHFLMESFKEDVVFPVLPIGSYASTIRRHIIDIAGKIIFHSKKLILKVSLSSFSNLSLKDIFERSKFAQAIS